MAHRLRVISVVSGKLVGGDHQNGAQACCRSRVASWWMADGGRRIS
jgi:hypothetical protein